MSKPNTPGLSQQTDALPDGALDQASGGTTDGIGDLGAVNQAHLQQSSDPRTQAQTAASNLLKKISDTSNTISGNLK